MLKLLHMLSDWIMLDMPLNDYRPCCNCNLYHDLYVRRLGVYSALLALVHGMFMSSI